MSNLRLDLWPDEPTHDDRCATGCVHVNLPPQLSCPVHAHNHECTCEALRRMDAQAAMFEWVDFWHDQARDWEKVLDAAMRARRRGRG